MGCRENSDDVLTNPSRLRSDSIIPVKSFLLFNFIIALDIIGRTSYYYIVLTGCSLTLNAARTSFACWVVDICVFYGV